MIGDRNVNRVHCTRTHFLEYFFGPVRILQSIDHVGHYVIPNLNSRTLAVFLQGARLFRANLSIDYLCNITFHYSEVLQTKPRFRDANCPE